MEYLQIVSIALGFLSILIAVLNFLHLDSSLLVSNRIREFLRSESDRIKYQKATAMPQAMLGVFILILAVFCWHNVSLCRAGYFVCMGIWIVWMLVINKKCLGWYFPYGRIK